MTVLANVFAVLIKCSVSVNFYAANLLAMETYPTCLRQTGISTGSVVANIFGMFGPYIVFLVSVTDGIESELEACSWMFFICP